MSDSIATFINRDYGITTTGFHRMRLPEIREEIITTLQTKTGLVFETRPDSITGEFINTFAEREAALWELAEAVYHAMYPVSAFGTNLDHSVSFAGVTRLFARKSLVLVNMYGKEGTPVRAGTIVKENISRMSLALIENATISQDNASDVKVIVETAVVGNTYAVEINNVVYDYLAVIGDDVVTIAAALANEIDASIIQVTTDANTIRMFVTESITFSFAIVGGVKLVELGSSGAFAAEEYGPIALPVNSVTIIVTTANGFERVNNIVPGLEGRDNETDDELRRRYETGVFRLGAATVESIYANLLQTVPGILALKVYENEHDVPDADGRVPHCIEVVCWGGDARIIARELWLLKPAGIDTFGDTVVTVADSAGYLHDIHFNRPTQVFMWVHVTVTRYNKELFPPNGDMQIKKIITLDGNTLGVDTDVIVQRLFCAVFDAISGIETLTITVTGSTDPLFGAAPGDYSGATFVISPRQLSRFDDSRITVVIT
jgi:uncharacterized phage protein gp47/JayE